MQRQWELASNFAAGGIRKLAKRLFENPAQCIRELVANSYDADATSIQVILDFDNNTLNVIDDGHGMREKELKAFLIYGETTKHQKYLSPKFKRPALGRFGMNGKFAITNLAERCLIVTRNGGYESKFYVDRGQLNHGKVLSDLKTKVVTKNCDQREHGTVIYLESLSQKISTSDLVKELCRAMPNNEMRIILTVKQNGHSKEYSVNDQKIGNPKNRRTKQMSAEKKEKLLQIKDSYDRLGTLEAVGKELGVSRERIRQLLFEGNSAGLYVYRPTNEKKFEELTRKYNRQSFLREIKSLTSTSQVCRKLNINPSIFERLLQHFQVDWQGQVSEEKKLKCMKEYASIVTDLGHHPTTTEMNAKPEWRNLWCKIDRIWKSFENFRKELNIPQPKRTWPKLSILGRMLSIQKTVDKKKKKKNNIVRSLQTEGPLSHREICKKLGYSQQSTWVYLKELSDEKKVKPIGGGNKVKYEAIKGGS